MRRKTNNKHTDEWWLVEAVNGRVDLPIPPTALGLADTHRIDGLIGASVLKKPDLPHEVQESWKARMHALAAADAARHAELSALCADLSDAGLTPLLLKGAGLAYTDYALPWQRPGDDVDVWCEVTEGDAFRRLLERRGYTASVLSRPSETGQVHFIRCDAAGVHHQVELHFRVLTPLLFADVLTFGEALQNARPVPALGGTLTLGSTHALFLACLHRVAHHFQSPRLIWLYDIHLLGRLLQRSQWTDLRALAERTAMRAVVWRGLEEASRSFGLEIPDEVTVALKAGVGEPSEAFLKRQVREVDVQWSNLRHASSWQARGALIRNRLLPSPEYMRARYGTESSAWLPALYLWRVVTRAPSWLVGYRSADDE